VQLDVGAHDRHQAVRVLVVRRQAARHADRERDTQPQNWYPRSRDGSLAKFDDLPAAYLANVDRQAPFDRREGEKPAMSEQDIEDVVAFLQTLSDGYDKRRETNL
jgi:hypothetical protein